MSASLEWRSCSVAVQGSILVNKSERRKGCLCACLHSLFDCACSSLWRLFGLRPSTNRHLSALLSGTRADRCLQICLSVGVFVMFASLPRDRGTDSPLLSVLVSHYLSACHLSVDMYGRVLPPPSIRPPPPPASTYLSLFSLQVQRASVCASDEGVFSS